MHHTLLQCVCLCDDREQVQRSEESSPTLAASLRLQSMKQSPSQHSFDSAILDGSLPDENLSVDSDASDTFVVLMDSGAYNTMLHSLQWNSSELYKWHVNLCFISRVRH